MSRARGILALIRSVFLGLVLVAAVQPGAEGGPDARANWAAPSPPTAALGATPFLGKRWR